MENSDDLEVRVPDGSRSLKVTPGMLKSRERSRSRDVSSRDQFLMVSVSKVLVSLTSLSYTSEFLMCHFLLVISCSRDRILYTVYEI